MKKLLPIILSFAFLITSCGLSEADVDVRVAQTVEAISVGWTASAATEMAIVLPSPSPFSPSSAVPTSSPAPTLVATTTPISTSEPYLYSELPPEDWREWPVIPTSISPKMIAVYELGQLQGNNPNAFTKIGDCHSMPPEFFAVFEEDNYDLGEFAYLQATIDYFPGSFARQGRAAKLGLTATGVLSVLWNDWKDCTSMETPLDCEYRLQKPSFVIISLGTNDANGSAPFETTLRRVIDVTIGNGVVPILATKADNAEGDHALNETIARLAYEYEIPMWNFWRAVQPLPDHGVILPDHREHLSYPAGFVSRGDLREEYLEFGYNMRNLTGLQVLDVVRRNILGEPLAFIPTPLP